MKKIASALGLAEGATEDEIVSAVSTLVGTSTAICSALGLQAGASKDAITAKVGEIRTAASQGGQVDPSKFVPMSEFTALKARVDATDEERATASVDDAIAKGKVTPAGRDWALGYAKNDPEGFAKFVGVTPEIVAGGAVLTEEQRRAAAIASDTLTDEEKAICAQAGITPENFLKSRKEFAR